MTLYRNIISEVMLKCHCTITVFLSCFCTFLRAELKFSKLFVQPSANQFTCAHHKYNFSSLYTHCKCLANSSPWLSGKNNRLLFPIISCLCHYDQNVFYWFSVELPHHPTHRGISSMQNRSDNVNYTWNWYVPFW